MPSAPRSPRAGERGSAMVVMLIVMVALGTIASLTVVSVQGGSATVNAHRFNAIALYAAESGALAAMNWLKVNYDDDVFPDDPDDDNDGPGTKFSQYVDADNANPPSPIGIPGNNAQPGSPDNLFSPDQQAWYEVRILNNRSDPGLSQSGGVDTDGVVIIDVTGHGPNGAVKRLEWEVLRAPSASLTTPGENPMVLIGWRELF